MVYCARQGCEVVTSEMRNQGQCNFTVDVGGEACVNKGRKRMYENVLNA